MNLESPATNPSPIHDSDELLKDAEHLLQYGTWIWNTESGSLQLSHGMYRLLGRAEFSSNHISFEDFLRCLPDADSQKLQRQAGIALETAAAFELVHSLRTGHGHELQVLTKAKTTQRHGSKMLIGITQEISRLQEKDDEALQHRSQMNEYEVFLKFGTWRYDGIKDELNWSAGMYSLYGYDAEKDKHMPVNLALYSKHLDPEDIQQAYAIRKELERNDASEYFWQYRVNSATGEHKWLETYGHVMRDENGSITGTFGITRDITRLKLYEHSLESKIRELNRSNAELEEFAYVASHDMQEPLRKLITFSERLITKFGDSLQDEGKLYLNRMQAATNNMRLLIDNLLDFSRIARTGDAFEDTDLNEVLQKALGDLEVSIEETKAIINPGKLPVIEAQSPQMKQLFTNIISNAIKFRKPDTSPQISIQSERLSSKESDKLNLERNKKYFRIEITDNGIGFEPEYAQRIFQIFQRLHGKAEYPGSGIGLAICKKIVDYHNGLIYANGQLDQGAIVTIILPEKQ